MVWDPKRLDAHPRSFELPGRLPDGPRHDTMSMEQTQCGRCGQQIDRREDVAWFPTAGVFWHRRCADHVSAP